MLSYEKISYPMYLEVLSYEKISYPTYLEVLSYEKTCHPNTCERVLVKFVQYLWP